MSTNRRRTTPLRGRAYRAGAAGSTRPGIVRAVQALPHSLVELVRGQSTSTDEHGLGWGLAPGSGASPSAIAHSGATGSILVVDPAQDLVIVYLRNWWGASMNATTQAVEAVYAAVS